LRKELVCAFREASFTVVDVSDYPEALLRIEEFKPDIVVMEIGSPGRDGFEEGMGSNGHGEKRVTYAEIAMHGV